ncbi:hypothetical protein K493DRAFT_69783 [Basidiobolus meristosporus CBS 931.73]|uniref:Uncharacterized protein n=1 Tax=Basidiobolus meristosporus CBS 931.73 TaxID=1314790 RepID=A0A1Y1XU55_9FUNG|nr:hypothetical protein K493DRAFT_69783 [Basidiobolus meristosporus CBS 931.73]|eukprot:ORX89292.1 hypothetical protein K493DRAFT_69783 [Basidiobolus meristosporus CBS 931.73]
MGFSKFLLILATLLIFSMITISSGLKFTSSPECSRCFQALGGGCKSKIEKASTNTALSRKALKDCLCTSKYFDNFEDCATCSLQSTGSGNSVSAKDKEKAKKACEELNL